MNTVKGALDTKLLAELGWKPTYEGIWPFRRRLTGYDNGRGSLLTNIHLFSTGTQIPGFEDLRISHIEIEYLSKDEYPQGSVFGNSEEHESLYIWMYDEKILTPRPFDHSPFYLGSPHPIFRFVSGNDTDFVNMVLPYPKLDLNQLHLYSWRKQWYPSCNVEDHFYSNRQERPDHLSRYLEALRVLIH